MGAAKTEKKERGSKREEEDRLSRTGCGSLHNEIFYCVCLFCAGSSLHVSLSICGLNLLSSPEDSLTVGKDYSGSLQRTDLDPFLRYPKNLFSPPYRIALQLQSDSKVT